MSEHTLADLRAKAPESWDDDYRDLWVRHQDAEQRAVQWNRKYKEARVEIEQWQEKDRNWQEHYRAQERDKRELRTALIDAEARILNLTEGMLRLVEESDQPELTKEPAAPAPLRPVLQSIRAWAEHGIRSTTRGITQDQFHYIKHACDQALSAKDSPPTDECPHTPTGKHREAMLTSDGACLYCEEKLGE